MPPNRRGLDRNVINPRLWKLLSNLLHKRLKSLEHLFWRIPARNIIFARVQNDFRRPIWNNDPICESRRIGNVRAPKTAPNRHQLREGLRQVRPKPDARTPDEQNRSFG